MVIGISLIFQVVGPFGNVTDQLFGDYASDILPQYVTTVLIGLSKLTDSVKFAPGCTEPACTKYNASEVSLAYYLIGAWKFVST